VKINLAYCTITLASAGVFHSILLTEIWMGLVTQEMIRRNFYGPLNFEDLVILEPEVKGSFYIGILKTLPFQVPLTKVSWLINLREHPNEIF
jgi:hypothetical protein